MLLRSIELYGTEVAPAVRAEIARRTTGVASPSASGSIPADPFGSR
jgi:hypothetical protein